MQSVILVSSARHQSLRDELARRVNALGWRASADTGIAVLVIADAQSWESEGLRAAWDGWSRRLQTGRLLVLWVSSWLPLPAHLRPEEGVKAWKGGQLTPPEWEIVQRFLDRCAASEARAQREITAAVAPAPIPEVTSGEESAAFPAEGASEGLELEEMMDEAPPTPQAAPPPAPVPSRVQPLMPGTAPAAPKTLPRILPVPVPVVVPSAVPPPPAAASMPAPVLHSQVAPAAKTLEREPGEAKPAAEAEKREVRTSVYCPETLSKGRWFTMQIWLHFPEQSGEVRRQALESGHGEQAGSKAGLRMRGGALVGFSLVPQVLHTKRSLFGPRQPVHRYVQWNETATNVEFPVCCPKGFRDEVLHETIEISVEGIPVGSCTVSLAFDRAGEMESQFSRMRTAFASYSSQDREQVIGRLQMLAATVGVEPFFDVDALRMGEDWEQRLMREVPTKDRFLLFWSENARKSDWVEREWRLALRERGVDYILPVPLQPASPPKELSKLQFNDRYARMAEYERLKRQAAGAG